MLTATIKPTRVFSDNLLHGYRQQRDPPADAVITTVVEQGGRKGLSALMGWLADAANLDISVQPVVVQSFFAEFNRLPSWANPIRMQRGMAFFQQHSRAISLILGCYSLPYCYLGANGAQVLWLTERIKNDTARRLQETGEWLFAVMNPKSWLTPSVPIGVIRTLKIRLIHAAARWFTLSSNRWDMAWGYPINQEDMAGTNLSFSYIVLRGLRQLGISATVQDEEDYLHQISVIGFLNGVAEDLLPQNLREAFLLDRSIARRQFTASEAGIGLTNALLQAIVGQASNGKESNSPDSIRNLVAAEMRFFLGDPYADMLRVPAVALEKRMIGVVNLGLKFVG